LICLSKIPKVSRDFPLFPNFSQEIPRFPAISQLFPLFPVNSRYVNTQRMVGASVDSVTNIGDFAFFYCTGLASVSLGNGVASIGAAAFAGCASLTSVTHHYGPTFVGSLAKRHPHQRFDLFH